VFDDVRDGIEWLRDGGYDPYVVSNGNPEMLASMVEHADIGGLIEETISADEIQTFKPAGELYRHATVQTGTPVDEIPGTPTPTCPRPGRGRRRAVRRYRRSALWPSHGQSSRVSSSSTVAGSGSTAICQSAASAAVCTSRYSQSSSSASCSSSSVVPTKT